ncbi:Abi family protein [Leuconostoc mesenteroides]|uniref:Abi family protein n=1 Tax=Leuconostoc mesenteroides TaxID=1245 RepID=UPI0006817F9E|nr:Abi family protein [Leuconostoc mesenteroides]KMY78944.1 hypothetical protein WZ79_01385 [Leuconostoc mesenteroides subsp. mesenteroides]
MPDNLTFNEQKDLLSQRGMVIPSGTEARAIQKLGTVSYYRIKEFAKPFEISEQNGKIYDGLEFSKVLARYYRDKNLRMDLLHAIEQIEVAVKTHLAYIMGTRYGTFGYLNISNWIDRSQFNSFQTAEKKYYFSKNLLNTVRKTSNPDAHKSDNLNESGLPSVWLGINILTFGEMYYIIKDSKKSITKELSDKFNCTRDQFVSWLGTLNLVRNICAHNGNLVNLNLITKPMITEEISESITYDDNDNPICRLGTVIKITQVLVREINPHYKWDKIQSHLKNLCEKTQGRSQNEMARIIGFKNYRKIINITKKHPTRN